MPEEYFPCIEESMNLVIILHSFLTKMHWKIQDVLWLDFPKVSAQHVSGQNIPERASESHHADPLFVLKVSTFG